MIRFLFYGQEGQNSILQAHYQNPVESIRLNVRVENSVPAYPTEEDLLNALSRIDEWKKKYDVACLFSYEMGCIFQKAPMPGPLPVQYPVLAAYAFPPSTETTDHTPIPNASAGFSLSEEEYFDLGPTRHLQEEDYSQHIQSIQEKIRSGLSYQVNYTSPLTLPFSGKPESFFHWLRKRFPSPYSVFADLEDRQFVSISPELFFSCAPIQEFSTPGSDEIFRSHATPSARKSFQDGYRLEVRPMKGTVRASKDPARDSELRQRLMNSEKDKAELAMITDLMRNDLGRISPPGGVSLERAIQPESYVYVHQLTSVISAFHRTGELRTIIPSLFPSGSITGAPRRETMKIISREESDFRGIYTGSIGLIRSEQAVFNVAIRTADISNGILRYGAGGGITLGSDAKQEWNELHWKARPLNRELPGLIETMGLSHGRIRNRDLHLKRLLRSARVLNLPGPWFPDPSRSTEDITGVKDPIHNEEQTSIENLDSIESKGANGNPGNGTSGNARRPESELVRKMSHQGKINETMQSVVRYLESLAKTHPTGSFRLRLHWSREGKISHEIRAMEGRTEFRKRELWKIRLADFSMSSRDQWLLHKVDRRNCYNEELAKARNSGYDEVLFFNERNEITEGSITNLFYRLDSRWYTPPVRCGLLPGVGRSRILHRWPHRIALRTLKVNELSEVSRFVLVNSLRGLIEAKL